MNYIERDHYLEMLDNAKNADVIKVLTGVRRCGKSTIMQMFRDRLENSGVSSSQIFFANMEDIENNKWVNDFEGLYYHIIDCLDVLKPCYVFLDEIQNVRDFEKLIDGLFAKPNIDVYITGSNAYLLSSELGTLLTGRYIEINVLPFSFAEYIKTKEDTSRLDMLFSEYLQNGGMPGTVLSSPNIHDQYLNDICESIITKDIAAGHNFKNMSVFRNVLQFMLGIIGSEYSVNNIAKQLCLDGVDISRNTLDSYLEALLGSYLFYDAKRYDVKGKNLLKTQNKYYTVDLGFKNAILGRSGNANLGHNLENVVYFELLRRYKWVRIGKVDNLEIDFVACTFSGDIEYFQVAYTVRDESTLERELEPFRKVKDFNRRTLITQDVDPVASYDGIMKINAIDWLLAKG